VVRPTSFFDEVADAGLAGTQAADGAGIDSCIASAIGSENTVSVMRLALPTGTRYNHPA
jgi:hypothetical protein